MSRLLKSPPSGPVRVAFVVGPDANVMDNAGSWEVFQDTKIATAGGRTSGIELALRVVERYYGGEAAAQTAYFMEYTRSPERPGR